MNELAAGSYTFPFQFKFDQPRNLPPTFDGACGYIHYKIVSKVHRPGIKLNDKKKIPIVILPVTDCNGSDFNQKSQHSESKTLCCCCCADGPIEISVEIPRRAYAAGNKLDVKVNINNNSKKVLNGYSIVLRRDALYYSGYHKSRSRQYSENTQLVSEPEPIQPHATVSKTINVTIPPVCPSFPLSAGRAIQLTHAIAALVKIPGPHMNTCPGAPLMIGTVPYSENGAAAAAPAAGANTSDPVIAAAADPAAAAAAASSSSEPPQEDYMARLQAQLNDLGGAGGTTTTTTTTTAGGSSTTTTTTTTTGGGGSSAQTTTTATGDDWTSIYGY